MIDRQQLIERLRHSIDEAMSPYVKDVRQLVLLDFPNHANVGDSAIYLGELAYFKRATSLRPSFVSEWSSHDWDALDRTVSSGPIFLHGGGNFGDVWGGHQGFREAILERYPKRLVVQLPQTLHYQDQGALKRTANIIKRHGNFVLMVRDERSYKLARSNFACEVHKCPDMAFYIGLLPRPADPAYPLLLLMRTDREAQGAPSGPGIRIPSDALTADWLDEAAGMKERIKAQAVLGTLSSFSLSKAALRERYYALLAHERVARGRKLLGSGGFVITDRLHAHILCTLMNIPHAVLDNNYGKVSGFMDLWTSDYERSHRVVDLRSAMALWASHSKATH